MADDHRDGDGERCATVIAGMVGVLTVLVLAAAILLMAIAIVRIP